jgi:polyhydroxybutyrate depolymerase
MLKNCYRLALLAWLLFAYGTIAFAGLSRESIRYAGADRHYFIFAPSTVSPEKLLPLLMVFHGGGGNAEQVLQSSDLLQRAEKEGWILVSPAGSGRLPQMLTWNVGFGFGYALERRTDDIGFVRNLIATLKSAYPIDPNRIFATGISNGGILCHMLAAHLSDQIAAIAPIVATAAGRAKGQASWTVPPSPQHPVSVIAFNGALDRSIPLEGGWQKKSWAHDPVEVWSVRQTTEFWVKHTKCNPAAVVEKSAAGQYERHVYQGGIGGSEVVQYVLLNQGHAWPGGKKGFRLGDEPSSSLSANELMFEFFKSHGKKAE